MRDLIVDDLNTQPPDEWDDVLDRFDDAYHVRFALFDEKGNHLLGTVDNLPAEVHARMQLVSPPGRRVHRRGVPGRSCGTVQPTRYWLLVAARVDNPRRAAR